MNEQNKTTTTAKNEPRELLELLMYRVEAMTEAQQAYFRANTQTNLKLAKALESKVAKALQELRRLGYNPDRFNQSLNTQKTLL